MSNTLSTSNVFAVSLEAAKLFGHYLAHWSKLKGGSR